MKYGYDKPMNRYKGSLKILNSESDIPMTIITGSLPGKTVLITAGIHSTEYVGIQAAAELSNEINPARVHGRIIILPIVNVSGFEHRTQSVFYTDKKDLYKIFPGNLKGTEAEKVAVTLANGPLEQVDYYIDLHSGDGFESLIPHVFHVKTCDDYVTKISLEMAMHVDAEYRIEVSDDCEGTVAWAASRGIPGVLIERGGMGTWTPEEVEQDKQDVIRILKYLGIIRSQEAAERFAQAAFSKFDILSAPVGGLWYPTKKAGDAFLEGEVLGYIKDVFGEIEYTAAAAHRGIILYQIGSLNVIEGDILTAYACY